MNRHVDFCSDSECPDCEPEAFREAVERKRDRAIQATKDLTDEQLEYVLTLRKEKALRTRVDYLQTQYNKKLEEAQVISQEMIRIQDQLKAVGTNNEDNS